MEEMSLPTEQINELKQACDALGRILGNDAPISPEQLICNFGIEEKLDIMYEDGKTINEIKEYITANAVVPKEEVKASLSSPKIVANGVAAFWEWAKIGFGMVDAKGYEARLSTCRGCEHYVGAPDKIIYKLVSNTSGSNKICAACGCMLEKKLWLASSNCPLPHPDMPGFSKWEEPIREKEKRKNEKNIKASAGK